MSSRIRQSLIKGTKKISPLEWPTLVYAPGSPALVDPNTQAKWSGLFMTELLVRVSQAALMLVTHALFRFLGGEAYVLRICFCRSTG